MSKLYILKKYLKEQAALIRATKNELKAYQKKHHGCDNGYYGTLRKLSWDYRHHHVAYSMLRGKTYDVIEKPNTRIVLDGAFIQEITNAHTEKNVCIGQE